MHNRTKIIDVELSGPPENVEGLDGYVVLKGLVRLFGAPLGYVEAPVANGRCTASVLRKAILEQHGRKIIQHPLRLKLAAHPRANGLRISDLFDPPPARHNSASPLVTVAVCTRNRSFDFARCLDSLMRLNYPALDILVVDNAPSSNSTKHLVSTSYPTVRYVCEPRPGLNWDRNRAICEARGEIIAYTDDDAVVDPGWVQALVDIFSENSHVMAVTGLVVPCELDTRAQAFFESYGGLGRGFMRQWVSWNTHGLRARRDISQFGTGANMAFRHGVFAQIGCFDPALDVGTLTHGGGDLEMFLRLLKEGHTSVYEPAAIVRHRYHRDYAQLRTQIARNAGFIASTGQIVITMHDDVTMPPCWLEKLVAPFAHPQVMAVTGNVLPMELHTEAQRLFEAYGGLGRGLKRIEADSNWFKNFRGSRFPLGSSEPPLMPLSARPF